MSLLRMEHDSVMYTEKNFWAVCLTATWPFVYVRHDLFACDMTHKRISGQYVSRPLDLLSMCNMTCLCVTLLAKRISRPYASRRLDLSSMCDMTCWCATWLVNVRHGSFTYGTWLSHEYGKNISGQYASRLLDLFVYVRHDLFACDMTHKCAIWLLYVWNMTQSCIQKRISGQYTS